MTGAWHVVKDVVKTEVAIWHNLGRWITRRPDVPVGATPIGYAQMVAPVLWLWIIASGGEVVAVELILRSINAGWVHVIRFPLLALGIWGQLWMLGLMAAYRVRPHLLLDDRIRIRVGPRTWADVPEDAIATVRTVEHEFDGIVKSVHDEDGLLLIGVSRRTNLELVLTEPTALTTFDGDVTADRVGLWVDEPREAAHLLRNRYTTSA